MYLMIKTVMLIALTITLSGAACPSTSATLGSVNQSTSRTKESNVKASVILAQLRAGKVDGVEFHENLDYLGSGREEKLDLYLPTDRSPSSPPAPAIVIIHGGGWAGGDKAARRELVSGIAFARAGYVAVSVEYEKREGKRWPTNLHDCKNGVRWLRTNAEKYNINGDRIGVIGGSAGGHLALMVAYTGDMPELSPPEPYPGVSDKVQACVNMYGITNLLTRQRTDRDGTPNGRQRTTTTLFAESREEAPQKWELASPVSHVSAGSPPTLTIHGTKDVTVDRDQAFELEGAMEKVGGSHELLIIEGGIHAVALDDYRLPADLRPVVVRFFDRWLKRPAVE